MINKTKISVIIPVYNAAKYIEDCIRSVFNQTVDENIEIILINDCTPDSSMDIARSLQTACPNSIKMVFHDRQPPNRGPSCARNLGIRLATGKYIIFLDADDLLAPFCLELLYKNIIAENADVVEGMKEGFNETDQIEWQLPSAPLEVIVNRDEQIIPLFCRHKWSVTPWNKLFLREFIFNESLWFDQDVKHGEDFLWNFKFATVASCFVAVKVPTYGQRCQAGSISQNFDASCVRPYSIIFAEAFCRASRIDAHIQKSSLVYCLESKRNSIIADAITYLPRGERNRFIRKLRCFRYPFTWVLRSDLGTMRTLLALSNYLPVPFCVLIHRLRMFFYKLK